VPEPAIQSPPRRRLLLRLLASLAVAAGAAAMLVLLVGRLASDRWEWSQPLFWIPGIAPVMVGALLAASGLVLARAARWRRGRRVAVVLFLAASAGGAWVAAVEWRVGNVLRRPAPADPLRLLAWNATDVGPEAFEAAVAAEAPDIFIAINPPLPLDWIGFTSRLWNLPREDAARRLRASGAVVIASRFTPVESGGASLGLHGVVALSDQQLIDTGRAAFATLQIDGSQLTIWAIDLPSDPSLGRAAAARQAREAVDSATLRTFRLSDRGDHFVPGESQGFPAPDIIVGDFNTTRGAASLAPLVGGLRDAHAAAGLGPDATWPRHLPLLGLDQAFVGPGIPLRRYDVIDAGAGTHRMQRLVIGLPEGP
jgi:hypothetical protein